MKKPRTKMACSSKKKTTPILQKDKYKQVGWKRQQERKQDASKECSRKKKQFGSLVALSSRNGQIMPPPPKKKSRKPALALIVSAHLLLSTRYSSALDECT